MSVERVREGGVVTLPSAYIDVHWRRAVDGAMVGEERRAGMAISEIVVIPPEVDINLALIGFYRDGYKFTR
jgi:hypothetical protein